jgi:DNA-binding transcriptional MerR regulator
MRISALAARSGVPLSAIKYYQREGMLPPGTHTAPNQVDYGDIHLRRLRLIRALVDTGGLSITKAKTVLQAIDADPPDLAETFSAAQLALAGAAQPSSATALRRIRALVTGLGWRVRETNPGFALAAGAVDGFAAIDYELTPEELGAYAAAAAQIARVDLGALATRSDPELIMELMVVGTVMGDALAAGLRLLAQEAVTTDLTETSRTKDNTGDEQGIRVP